MAWKSSGKQGRFQHSQMAVRMGTCKAARNRKGKAITETTYGQRIILAAIAKSKII